MPIRSEQAQRGWTSELHWVREASSPHPHSPILHSTAPPRPHTEGNYCYDLISTKAQEIQT